MLNVPDSPAQRTASASGVAVRSSSTVSAAEFVTLPQAPLTSTAYVPASDAETLVSVRLEFVAPSSTKPSCRQTKVNGPVPPGAVWNATFAPAQTLAPTSGVAVTGELTVSVAKFVTALHTPEISTE